MIPHLAPLAGYALPLAANAPTSLLPPALLPAQQTSVQLTQMTQLTLVPVAPLLLLPLILVVFVVFTPIWAAALLVIAILRGIFWPIERVLAALHVPGAGEASEALARANRWVSTLGGLTERYTASRRQASEAAEAADEAERHHAPRA